MGVSDMGGAYIHTDTPPTGIDAPHPSALVSPGALARSPGLAYAGGPGPSWAQMARSIAADQCGNGSAIGCIPLHTMTRSSREQDVNDVLKTQHVSD